MRVKIYMTDKIRVFLQKLEIDKENEDEKEEHREK